MSKYLKGFILFIAVIVLMIIFTPVFGELYKAIVNRPMSAGFWGPDPKLFSGFLMAYVFFIPLILTIFGGKNKYWIIIALVAVELLFFFGAWEAVIIDAVTALIGWLLGEGILFGYRKLKPAVATVAKNTVQTAKIKSVKK